jgi:hypothetical protein
MPAQGFIGNRLLAPASGSVRDHKETEGTSDGYDRGRGAGEAEAILIDCSDGVIVSTDSCDRIR